MNTRKVFPIVASLLFSACVSTMPVEQAKDSSSFSTLSLTCSKPVKLTQDCSHFGAANRQIKIEEVFIDIASNESGDKVLIMDGKRGKNAVLEKPFVLNSPRSSKAVNDGFPVVEKILKDNGVAINKILVIKSLGDIDGYILTLSKSGYKFLLPYSTKGDKK